ncbi:DUF2779 domain-containing protein [bacterium]|nr:DUF2779 domain-containing protein [bacterium]MCB2179101.1 DUF2779 domain-containing protein [bacterium]
MNLTKTDFLIYLNAPMHLWADKHDQLTETTPSLYDLHLMKQGQAVENMARDFLIDYLAENHPKAVLEFQKTVSDGPYLARLDGAVYHPDEDCWDIYEIKSASSIRKEHLYDAAFQRLVAERELNVRNTYLMHINKAFQQLGEASLEGLFQVVNVDTEIDDLRAALLTGREAAWKITSREQPAGVETCLKPGTCPCPELCHPSLPDHPIYDIPRLSAKKARELQSMGITAIEDIPADYPLSENQRRHVNVVQARQPQIDPAGIRAELENMHFPLYFLDYETFNPAVPMYAGYAPYQHMVFQYSLDVYPGVDAEPAHHEYLATEPGDPALPLVEHLLERIGEHGSVVVWNKAFEGGRNREMAALYPQYAARLENINARMYDLMEIFSKGKYVHPDFHGSASIKYVLPVLAEDLNYEGMAVSKGDEAMMAWMRLMTEPLTDEEKAQIQRDMLAYCALDTLAMVRNWQFLVNLVGDEN